MGGRGADIDADAGQVGMRADGALVVVAVIAVALVLVPDDRHNFSSFPVSDYFKLRSREKSNISDPATGLGNSPR